MHPHVERELGSEEAQRLQVKSMPNCSVTCVSLDFAHAPMPITAIAPVPVAGFGSNWDDEPNEVMTPRSSRATGTPRSTERATGQRSPLRFTRGKSKMDVGELRHGESSGATGESPSSQRTPAKAKSSKNLRWAGTSGSRASQRNDLDGQQEFRSVGL
jgi:hypothetical protein